MFRVATFRGRPVVAVMEEQTIDLQLALRVYPRTTFKKQVFSTLLQMPCLGSFAWRCKRNPFDESGFEADELVDNLLSRLGYGDCWPVIVWPRGRPDRVHIHVLNSRGERVGFAKVMTGSHVEGIENECRALSELCRISGESFRIPGVVAFYKAAEYSFLLVEALPLSANLLDQSRHAYPEQAVNAWRGNVVHLGAGEMREREWCRGGCDLRHPALIHGRKELERSGGRVCRVHGDLGSENLYVSNGALWVIDWEHSCEAGPIAADYTGYWLGAHLKLVNKDPSLARSLFLNESSDDYSVSDRIAALMFLQHLGYGPAKKLLE